MTQRLVFGDFAFDPGERLLLRGGERVELGARYLDALHLLLIHRGELISKERFHDTIWHGVPVTDDALTQCIRSLRQALGDKAGNPEFIETVPKHGYRFIAEVEPRDRPEPLSELPVHASPAYDWTRFWRLGLAATSGGGVAGMLSGLFYGIAGGAAQGAGAMSVLLVLLAVNVAIAALAGAGIGFGLAAVAGWCGASALSLIAGAALGGLITGGIGKLLGLDAFTFLLGEGPGKITGGAEGLAFGLAIGVVFAFAIYRAEATTLRRILIAAALAGLATGALIPVLGGTMMGGSLAELARAFPSSQLQVGRLGTMFGEPGFGTRTAMVTGALEGLLFMLYVMGALALVVRRGPRAGGV